MTIVLPTVPASTYIVSETALLLPTEFEIYSLYVKYENMPSSLNMDNQYKTGNTISLKPLQENAIQLQGHYISIQSPFNWGTYYFNEISLRGQL